MPSGRSRFDADEAAGQDSFLDIVANIVGILILLVMVVGVRAARRPVANSAEESSQQVVAAVSTQEIAVEATAKKEQAAKQARSDLAYSAKETEKLILRAAEARSEVALQDDVRVQLAAYVATAEQELAEKRETLAADEREDYDRRVAIAEAQRQLDELTRRQAANIAVDAQVEMVENLPTPLAKTVDGEELFLMLSEGKVAVIPLDALRNQLYSQLDRRIRQLAGRDSISFVVGPVGGFRMRFLVRKARIPTPNGYRIVARPMWELIPSDDLIAEPVDLAIDEGSALMTELAAYAPHDTTVTVVTYADSFNEYRTLKKALYGLGYPVAGRPQKLGQSLIGSPDGSRSAAQ